MILYHGSNTTINEIDLSLSKPYKDFGHGFYLSDTYEQAMQMAGFRCRIIGGEPIVTSFEFDETILHDGTLRFLSFEDYSIEWAQFVLNNRDMASDFQHEYDVIYGPIANDRVSLQIQKLQEKSISMDEFLHRLKYMQGITFQYFFGMEKAITYLHKL